MRFNWSCRRVFACDVTRCGQPVPRLLESASAALAPGLTGRAARRKGEAARRTADDKSRGGRPVGEAGDGFGRDEQRTAAAAEVRRSREEQRHWTPPRFGGWSPQRTEMRPRDRCPERRFSSCSLSILQGHPTMMMMMMPATCEDDGDSAPSAHPSIPVVLAV